jgi:membrane protease YdiL (CAAX protease family)
MQLFTRGYYLMERTNDQNGRNVWAFFSLTFIYSWVLWLPFVLAGIGVIKPSGTLAALTMPAVMLGAFGPMLAAVTMIARTGGRPGVKHYFRQAFNIHIKAKYFALAVLLPLIITAATHYIANFTGIDNLPGTFLPENLPVPVVIAVIPYFLAMLVVGGGQEEFGWRGYAQEPLQQKFGVFGGSVFLGFVWGVWHLPLWFIVGDGHSDYSFLAFLLYTISLAVMIGWLYNASGKKVTVTWVLHAMSNTAVPLFPIMHLEKVPQPGYWLWVGLTCLSALGLTAWFWNRNKYRCLDEVIEGNNQQI